MTALPAETVSRLTEHVVSDGAMTTVTAPFTGEPLATLPISSATAVATAFSEARAAARDWARRSPGERAKPFLSLHDAILDRRDEVLDILQWETGKARKHALEEVLDVAGCCLYYARRAPHLLRSQRRRGVFPLATRVRELRRPKGIVGLISPWNYPLSFGVTDVVPALLAGNAVVQPDTQTALSCLWTVDLLAELGMPAGVWKVVLGDPGEIGDALIDGADYVAFTGSTRAGRAIAERAARRLTGYSLELGGKNPMIVLADADVEKAAAGAIRACFTNAGQLCISMERLYVHDAIYDRFMERFLHRVRGMRLGTSLSYDADMGSLTHERQLETVGRHVADARDKGATVLAGGNARPDVGPLFYEPTVLTGVTPEMAVCREETFGPVVSVRRFAADDEAVEAANDTEYGLNASVWTKDLARGRRLAARIEAGTVNVNEGYGAAYASYDAPMGGMKSSGVGRRHGADGLLRYTEAQTVASQQWIGFEPIFGMSQETYAAFLAGTLKAMRRLRLK